MSRFPPAFLDWYERKTDPESADVLVHAADSRIFAVWNSWKDELRERNRDIEKQLEMPFPWYHKVKGKAHSDDHRVNIEFDATPWFRHAALASIAELAEEDFQSCAVADDVMGNADVRSGEHERDIKDLLLYCTIGDMGYEVEIDAEAAKEYLQLERPAIYDALKERDLV